MPKRRSGDSRNDNAMMVRGFTEEGKFFFFPVGFVFSDRLSPNSFHIVMRLFSRTHYGCSSTTLKPKEL